MKLFTVLAAILFAVPTLAQDADCPGDYASQVAPGNPLHIPPGLYAQNAARLNEFFATTKGARTIFANVLASQIENGTAGFLLDTRTPADFAKGHVPGAVNIPLDTLFQPDNLALLPTDGTPIVVICHTGHTASMAMGGLVALGYNPYVLRFAMMGWNASSSQKIWTSSQSQVIYGLGGALEQ
jgi:rhodanese-related sulfurtransferase